MILTTSGRQTWLLLLRRKKVKEREKLIALWPEENIRIEKARWGRHHVIRGKLKVELGKEIDATAISLEEAKAMIEAAKPVKKPRKKPSAKK